MMYRVWFKQGQYWDIDADSEQSAVEQAQLQAGSMAVFVESLPESEDQLLDAQMRRDEK